MLRSLSITLAVSFVLQSVAATIPFPQSPAAAKEWQRAFTDKIAALDARSAAQFWKQQERLRRRLESFKTGMVYERDQEEIEEDEERDLVAAEFLAQPTPRSVDGPTKTRKRDLVCTPITATPAKNIGTYAKCVKEVQTVLIDDPKDGIQTKTTTKWANGNLPKSLRGVFYMEGSPFPDEVFSTARSTWNTTDQVWQMPAYGPKTWTSDPQVLGLNEQNSFRKLGSVLRSYCAQNALTNRETTATWFGNGTVCRTDNFLEQWDTNFSWGEYWSAQVSENYHIRTTFERWYQWPDGSNFAYNYNLWRIIDENGKRTPEFYSRFIANINQRFGYKGQLFVHLHPTLYIPQ